MNLKNNYIYIFLLLIIVIIIVLCFNLLQKNQSMERDLIDLLSYKGYSFILAYNQNFTEYIEEEGKYIGVIDNYRKLSREKVFQYLSITDKNHPNTWVSLGTMNGWYVNNLKKNHARVSFELATEDTAYTLKFEAEFKKIENKWQLIFIGYHG